MGRPLHAALICLFLFPPAFLQAQNTPGNSTTVRIPRVSRPPTMEDFLLNRERQAEAVVTGFVQRVPGDGDPVSETTTAYLSYDDDNFYLVFVCRDQPGKVRGRMSKREDILSDDLVGIYVDTFSDRRRAYAFLTNPLGIQLDGITTEGQGSDFSFDTLWHSEGQLTPDGYIVWMAIPFKSLRFTQSNVQQWRLALTRSIARKNEGTFWPYNTLRIQSFLEQFGTLEGLESVSPGRNMQFIPYGLFSRSDFLDRTALARRTENDPSAGLDAKFVLRDALTLDVALNPDFSTVESDEPQVTVNQRFEVFFPEKRPFFIENAGFFRTPINLFFSRRIVDPQFGVRLTGKVNRWALGVIAMDDEAPGKILPSSDPNHGDRAPIGVLRVQREFGEQSYFGVLFTSRDFASTSNRVVALDSRLRLNPNWVLSGQMAQSFSRGVNCTECQGPAYALELQRFARSLTYTGRYTDRSPDFRSQIGFIPRVDIRQTEQFVRYLWWPKNSRLLNFGPNVFTVVNWNRAGRVQDWFVDAIFAFEFSGSTFFQVRRLESFELFQDIEFRKHATGVSFSSDWLNWLGVSSNYSQGTRPNYFPAPPLAPYLAEFSDASAGFVLRPTPRLRYDQTYIYARLGNRDASAPAGSPADAAIFNNHLVRSRLNYQFSRELSLRAIVDYAAVLPNTSLVDLERSKRFATDFLLTYLVNPGTALYVGYTDIYQNVELLPGPPPSIVRTSDPTHSTGRLFFVKFSYLFRF